MIGDRPRRRRCRTPGAVWSPAAGRFGSSPAGFVEDGIFGAHFGESAEEAAAMLEAIGYRHEPITGVYRRSPATPEFLERR